MQVEQMRLEQVRPYAQNAKAHPPAQVAKIARTISEYGWDQPIVVDADLVIIKGHGRFLAAQELGLEMVPVVVAAHLSAEQVRAARLADNKVAESAWLPDFLALELRGLKDLDFDLDLTGFDKKEIDLLLPIIPVEGLTHPDKVPPVPENPVSKLGDVWLCGEHRVICGDATAICSWEGVMGGELADICWVDPPYNVNVEQLAGKIKNDNLKSREFLEFLNKLFGITIKFMKEGGAIYVAHSENEGVNFRQAFEAAGFKLSSVVIWRKNHFVLGRSDYQWMHEPILYGWRPGAPHRWYGGRKQTTIAQAGDLQAVSQREDGTWVIEVGDTILVVSGEALIEQLPSSIVYHDKPQRSVQHPTMKPVGLIEKQLQNSARGGDLVIDFCGGSGSTLIAAHRLGMRARLLELEPKFVDVIVERFQEYAGQEATLKATGAPFNLLKAQNGSQE